MYTQESEFFPVQLESLPLCGIFLLKYGATMPLSSVIPSYFTLSLL